MHDQPGSQPDASVSYPSAFSRRTLIRTGAVAAGLSAVGLSAFGVPAPALAAPGDSGNGSSGKPSDEVPFGPVTVTDGGAAGASYARAVRLSTSQPGRSRTLLATYQSFGGLAFPLFRSDDDGRTWTQHGSVLGATAAPGLYVQPHLYELPRAFAGLPKGALLFACNFWPFDLTNFSIKSTNIQLYASTDAGLTWELVSTVAQGGPPDTTNGATPVWEPFLLLNKDKLICYYSDQRDPSFGQKLAHQTSTDLHTWGPVVDDATGTEYVQRPGMTTVAQLNENLWIMTYELGLPDGTYPVHYRIAKDPEEFRFSEAVALVDQGGHAPNAAPVVTWSSSGSNNGTLVVSDADAQDFFINRDLGAPGRWTRVSSPMPAGYSRFTVPLDSPGSWQRPGLVFVITGPTFNDSFDPSKPHLIQAGVISLD
ncbi:sialidase family protein [Xylanimonas sp. McL0601]|uniref:sialidase family protein n=1 Tax=Xylanimonas sp. McL0601 TaxID=3414739 RepID=UPI003CF90D85